MSELFTDNTDSSFTDTETTEVVVTPVEPMPSGYPDTVENTATLDGTEKSPSPAPEEGTEAGAEDGQQKQQQDLQTKTYGMDDIEALLTQWQTAQEEYETKTLENQEFFIEQSKNQLTLSYLSILVIGFLSGILLARIVWRKL